MQKKPNVLFIVTDDQRFDTIHALGNKEIITPNLDKLAKSGTSFVRAHIAGGTCGAVCMPSRAMVMSGRNPFHLEELVVTFRLSIKLLLKPSGITDMKLLVLANGTTVVLLMHEALHRVQRFSLVECGTIGMCPLADMTRQANTIM